MGRFRSAVDRISQRMQQLGSDAGMSTAEYAIGTIAAVSLAAVRKPTRSYVPWL
jgi:hypothetical protein